MINQTDFDREVAAIMAHMARQRTPDDVVEKVSMILERLRDRLWPGGRLVQ